MRKYKFTIAPTHARQYRFRLAALSKESLRGVIRGSAHRERGLIPGAAKSRLRRRRVRLVHLYVQRLGEDAFVLPLRAVRLGASPRAASWLTGGYVHWRKRVIA